MSQARRQYEAKVQALQKAEAEIERLKAAIESQKDQWLSWEAKRTALEKDAARLDFIEFFTREPDEWERKYGRCKDGDTWCWTFYAPKGVQGYTRNIIDKAMEAK